MQVPTLPPEPAAGPAPGGAKGQRRKGTVGPWVCSTSYGRSKLSAAASARGGGAAAPSRSLGRLLSRREVAKAVTDPGSSGIFDPGKHPGASWHPARAAAARGGDMAGGEGTRAPPSAPGT